MLYSALLSVIQVSLSLLFLSSIVGKGLDSADFVAALRLTNLPLGVVPAVAALVIGCEAVCAIGLVQGQSPIVPVSFTIATGLFATFAAWAGWMSRRRPGMRCGCFGSSGETLGTKSVIRNIVLLAAATTGLMLWGKGHSFLPAPSLAYEASLLAMVLLVSLSQAFWRARPALVLSLRDALGSGAEDR